MPASRNAVIVEDDPDTRDLIQLILTQSGFTTVLADDSDSAIEAIREHEPLLMTLDINIPGIDGFAVAKRVREFSQTYMIIITSLTEEIDIVRGFEAGADDYLVKPFRPRELRARADAMLRRVAFAAESERESPDASGPAPATAQPESWAAQAARELRDHLAVGIEGVVERPRHAAEAPAPTRDSATTPPAQPTPAAEPAPSDQVLRFGALTFDPAGGGAGLGGRRLDLTAAEAEILHSLMRTGRRVRSKADLVLTLRGQQYVTSHFVNEADKRAVDGHVAGLRRKLGDDESRFIETVRGVGYRMATEPG
ncbi:response regulator [Nocardioides dongxiaopingii]|uniref:response regulator transcription factor n=1 Tax=Nocardioides sp. S-1144 TaxID=2582905 RepID=UPI00110ED2D0|nr:response regulator transcription factor [Nocardioides sp. S-1144]QCW50874.1 response regulator [Nocardioides sp. S-1144]